MKNNFTFLILLLSIAVFAQDDLEAKTKPIIAEGKLLYKSEMASWYGTDLFLENYKQRENIGGYFSYTEAEINKCVFFSNAESPKVIGTISFDDSYNLEKAKTDLTERTFTKTEYDLYEIRKIALREIQSDTLFKTYSNTALNLIPLISSNEKKVYVLTGPQTSGVVIFGNDYLMTFDNENKLILKKQLHKNIIPINYKGDAAEGKTQVSTIHSHLPETGDFITATDICTLMLYEKFTTWKTHNVVSKNYLNIWDCETNELKVISMSTIDKINKQVEKVDKKVKKRAK